MGKKNNISVGVDLLPDAHHKPNIISGVEMSSGLFELIALTRSQHIQLSNLLPSASVLEHTRMNCNVTLFNESKTAAIDGNSAHNLAVLSLFLIRNAE